QTRSATPCAARQGVEQRTERAARNGEDIFHSKLFQIFHNQIALGHGDLHVSSRRNRQAGGLPGSIKKQLCTLPLFIESERGILSFRLFETAAKRNCGGPSGAGGP